MKVHRILIAPLDWGLGHAARCVPIIYELLGRRCEVIIAASGESAELLKNEFPELKQITLKGYNIKYSGRLPSWLVVLLQLPKLIFQIQKEHRWLKKIFTEENINVVISDNRFGLWNKNITSVYITHQVMIKCPNRLKIFEPLLYRIHCFFIRRYSSCWIPDFPSDKKNLSGDLSHKYSLPKNAKYIGPQSRFKESIKAETSFDIVAVISGVEPQRTIFEELISDNLSRFSSNSIIIQGLPSKKTKSQKGMTKFISHLSSSDFEDTLSSANLIVCRSGYSTIMDLVRMKKNAVIIPTPGQTEQEYLAEELMRKGVFFSMRQSEFDINIATKEAKRFSVDNFKNDLSENLLGKTVDQLIDYQSKIQE